ncbi:MAG: hypothetical protein RL038_843 [Actinomycetota bacterium]|jgi:predicted RNA-binding protein YlqC (UPF0109 family)
MLEEALEHLIRGIVDNPDDVVVRVRTSRPNRDNRGDRNGRFNRETKTFEVTVNPEDLGRVIGRNGRTATALRTVISALTPGKNVRIDFLETDEL